MRIIAALGAFLLLLAGCSHVRPTPAVDSCGDLLLAPLVDKPGFQGTNAFHHVLELTCDHSRAAPAERVRVPGTQGRVEAALYLATHLRAAGWSVSFQNFTGADYDRLDAGSVKGYKTSGCDADERTRMLVLPFSNVIAERGTGDPVRILAAHYDTKRFATRDRDPGNRSLPVPGANDGASGVAVWLEAARVMPEVPGTLRIVFVDGEDGFEDCHPLAGSVYDARTMSEAQRARIAAVYLLDMVGDPNAHFCLAGNDATLRDQVKTAAASGPRALANAPDCSIFDDHSAYMDRGIKAVDVIDYQRPETGDFPPYWHTRADTPDKLSADMLGAVGSAMVRLLEAL